MKNLKKLISVLCLAAMVLALAACGGSGSSSGSSSGGSDGAAQYDQVTFAYATFNNIPTEEDLDAVEEAVNAITREKINVEVTLMPISIGEYVNKVNISLQGGEKIDVFQCLGNFGTCVAGDMCYDISELIDTCGAGAKAALGDEFVDACRINGVLYGLPTLKPFALTPMVIYRQDIADELGIDMSQVNDVHDVTDILRKVKEAKPEITPMCPVQGGDLGLNRTYGDVDWLSDDYTNPIGVLLDGEMTVVDLYSSDVFVDRVNLARTWYNEGLVMRDAATTASMAAELMSSGNYFCYMASYSYPEADTAASLAAQTGNFPIGAKMIDDAYLSTGDINAVSWMIASTTKVPEAAMKFLDLTYTDADVINLLIYGIEGRDYVLTEDGLAGYPEGQDAASVPYTAQLSCGTLGNFFKMYTTVGSNPDSLAWEEEQNHSAGKSPAMGFAFDASSLNTQYTAVRNVLNQYTPGLLCGSLDPEIELPKFQQALNDAGYQDILAAKQEQLDAWLAAK